MKLIDNVKSLAKTIKREMTVIYVAFKYKKLPFLAKISAGITVAYALSPIDLIPDFIPVLGYLDDLILLPLLIAITLKLIPAHLLIESRKDAELIWQEGWPKNWKYSILIIGLWLIILLLILNKVNN